MTLDAAAAGEDERSQSAPGTFRPEGAITVDAFDWPLSDFLGSRTRAELLKWAEWTRRMSEDLPGDPMDPDVAPSVRRFYDEHFFSPLVDRSTALYPVDIEQLNIGGVRVEVFTPANGLDPRNEQRVLINLHGGGFIIGAGGAGRLESIPVAALGKTRVVSVDYRMAPEHRFPAATDDVLAVYESLLKTYRPESIGIFGCSAGALLTAQAVARMSKEKVALPGAVGMLCAAGCYWSHGDSTHFSAARYGHSPPEFRAHPYFRKVDPDDQEAAPSFSRELLARFPASLLISSTRDNCLSGVVHMHSRLIALGVAASLHVWEGLDHAFFYNPDLPESHEVHQVVVRFFDRRLAEL